VCHPDVLHSAMEPGNDLARRLVTLRLIKTFAVNRYLRSGEGDFISKDSITPGVNLMITPGVNLMITPGVNLMITPGVNCVITGFAHLLKNQYYHLIFA
jgi:hypothetical protein